MLRGCASPEDVVFGLHITRQQKMCLVWKPDIAKKTWHSVNFVTKLLAHDITFKLKFFFNLYPYRILRSAIKFLRTDSQLIPRNWLRTDLLGLLETKFMNAGTLCGVLDDFGRPECDWRLASLWFKLWTVSWVLNPSKDDCMTRKFTTSKLIFE